MHGGAAGSGAPLGNQNALKHGAYSREAILQRQTVRNLLREAKELLDKIGGVPPRKLQGE